MKYEIKRNTTTIATVHAVGSQKKEVMGKDVVDMTFSLTSYVEFLLGDTVEVYSNSYVLNRRPQVEKVSSAQYNYTLQFEAESYDLNKEIFFLLDDTNTPIRPDFPLTLDASGFVDAIVANMNRNNTGWTKGTVDATDVRTISFDNDNCRAALSKIAEEFGIEFWIDGKEINLTKQGQLTTLEFEYGKGKGLYSITKSVSENKDVFSRLYVYGGTQNIPASYGQRLHLPSGNFIQDTDVVNKYGVIEKVQTYDDIYPHRTGTISGVTDEFTFTDTSMDFDVNDQLIEGVTAKIVFKSGDLAGQEFVINQYDNKTFHINTNDDDKNNVVPNENFKPAVGDKYTIVDIEMPQSYIDAAETELQTAGQEYYDKNANGRELYTVDCDPLDFKRKGIGSLNLGDFVKVEDVPMGIDRSIRIISIERDLQIEYKYVLSLADTATIATIVREYFEQQKTQIIIKQNNLDNVARARRNWRNTADLEDMVFDPEGDYYTDKIKPGSIETLYLAVGAKAQNFSLNGVVITPNLNADANSISISSGQLVHYTLEIKGIGYVWEMSSATFDNLDPNKSYYLFAKVSTSALIGTWQLLESPVEVDSITGYWMLGVGVLFSVEDGYRNFEFNKGMTYIVGDMIKTGRVQSMDAQNYFDLTSGRFNLGNSTSGLDWDVTKPDTLTIRGGIVQNPGGNEDRIGVYRGPWQSGATYYQGDEVSYNGSTWRYVDEQDGNEEPTANSAKWQIKAQSGCDAPRIIYKTNDDLYDPPELDRNDPDQQGWKLFLPGSDWASILATEGGDVIVTDQGLEIVLGEEQLYVWACTEILDSNCGFVEWKVPTRITGRPGQKGDYVEFRYKKNGSTTIAPPMSDEEKTDPEPDGWTIEKPKVSPAEYVWYITCTKSGNGTMLTPWSDPEPTNGTPGPAGPWMNYLGVYNPDRTYHGGGDYLNAVYYNGYYYISRADAGDFKGKLPTNKDYWNGFGAQFTSIATGLLLAQTAYVEKLIVGMLSTSADNTKARVVAKDAELDIFDAGGDNESQNAMIRIGKGAGIMSAAPDEKPGIAIRDKAGDDSYTENSSEGVFSNGSNVPFLPSTTGLKSNASLIGLLQKRNNDPRGISAAVVGIDQTSTGNSESWGGYFNSAKISGILAGGGLVWNSARVDVSYSIGDDVTSVYCYNNRSINVFLPTDPALGRVVVVRTINNHNVVVTGDSQHRLLSTTENNTYTISGARHSYMFQWDGKYWHVHLWGDKN